MKFLLRKYDITYSENNKYEVRDFLQQKSMMLSFRKHETWSYHSRNIKHDIQNFLHYSNIMLCYWKYESWWCFHGAYHSLNGSASLKKILQILEKSWVYPPKIYFLISGNVYVIIVQTFQYFRNRNIKNIINNSWAKTCNYSN